MPVCNGPDNVFRSKRRIAAKENAVAGTHHRLLINDRTIPVIKFDANVAFDPRKCVVLADGQNDIVTRNHDLTDGLAPVDPALLVDLVFHLIEQHPLERAAFHDKRRWRMIDDYFDVFLFRIFQFPVGCFKEFAGFARHDFDACRAEAQRAAATIHGRVADADDQDVLANRLDMLERDRLQPFDSDIDVFRVVPPGQLEFLASRRAAADKHRAESGLIEQRLHAVNGVTQFDVGAHVDDVANFLVEHFRWQPELRDIGAHEAAHCRKGLENGDFVAQRQQIVGNGQRRTAGANQRNLVAIRLGRRFRPTATTKSSTSLNPC